MIFILHLMSQALLFLLYIAALAVGFCVFVWVLWEYPIRAFLAILIGLCVLAGWFSVEG